MFSLGGHHKIEVSVVAFPFQPARIDSHLTPELVSDTSMRDRIFSIVTSIRERDVVTSEHSRRVAIYLQRMARALGFSRELAQQYALLGLLHDAGKAWISDDILNKTGSLTPEELNIIRAHATNGAMIVAGYDVPDFFIEGVYHHHEAYNGSGYPDHLIGDAIPLSSRMVAIADTFDVITSDRPYRVAASLDAALAEIESKINIQFDGQLAHVFIALARKFPHFLVPARLCVIPQNSVRVQVTTGF
jgi:putative nucleotidyltransferase with HDIG domain